MNFEKPIINQKKEELQKYRVQLGVLQMHHSETTEEMVYARDNNTLINVLWDLQDLLCQFSKQYHSALQLDIIILPSQKISNISKNSKGYPLFTPALKHKRQISSISNPSKRQIFTLGEQKLLKSRAFNPQYSLKILQDFLNDFQATFRSYYQTLAVKHLLFYHSQDLILILGCSEGKSFTYLLA